MPEPAETQVACAVILRPDGSFLLGQRPEGKVYAGWWEFPGGKVEAGESVREALVRELDEELGMGVTRAHPWLTRRFEYPHARVCLRFWRVWGWDREPRAVEHAALAWCRPERIEVAPVLPANAPIFAALGLPSAYALTRRHALGEPASLAALEAACRAGLRLVQVREPDLGEAALLDYAAAVIRIARPHGCRVLLNADPELARRAGADGVHLSARRLAALAARPELPLVGASVHSGAELARAAELGADFAVLGPVMATPTHPDAPTLGWEGFARLAADTSIPVYALGGVTPNHLADALAAGAHGVAMLRAAWEPPYVPRL